MKKTAIAILVLCALIAVSTPSLAETPKDGMAVVADVLLVRPVGLVTIVFGSVMWVVALPFSIPSDSVETAGTLLVGDPCRYTFKRPLGDFDFRPGTAEIPKSGAGK